MNLGPHLLLALMEGTVAAFAPALTALGLALVFGVMRIVNVAHGEFFMLGAVLAWAFAHLIGNPALGFLVAMIASPLIVGGAALAIDRLILRRFNYQPEATIVATIGLLYIIQQLVLIFYGPDARSVEAPINFRIQLPWFGYSGYKVVVAAVAALLLLATWYGIARTKLGLVMRATQFDAETAQAFGIPVDRVYAAVFALGAMLAAIAGVLIVPIKQAYYLMGLDPLLLSFIVVIIGGLGSLRGAIIAAFVIGISDGVISVFFSPNLSKILATLLVALVLVFRPEGLFGGKGAVMAGTRHCAIALHGGALAILFLLQFVLPPYHHTNFTSIMVLATYGIGYNILIGYTGLLSLGHAMFFAAGLYAAGLTVHYFSIDPVSAFVFGAAVGLLFATAVGLVALRTTGVSFMIVTMMFAQACFLLILYFNEVTRGDEGIVLSEAARQIGGISLIDPTVRYNLALALFAGALILCFVLIRSRVGRVLIAIRENEERVKMLGYHTFRYKLLALALSGLLAGAAGAAYALMFGYVGATFASIEYSIYALLWVLLGGSGTILGPIVGALLMFYLVEWTGEVTESYRIVVGAALVLLTLFFPKGILGTLREKRLRWLP